MVPENGTEPQAEQSRPVTRFQKVASALRGDKPDQTQPETEPTTGTADDTAPAEDYPGRDWTDDQPDQDRRENGPATGESGEPEDGAPPEEYPGRDWWDDRSSAKDPNRPVAVTQPDGLTTGTPDRPADADPEIAGSDHTPTVPDVFAASPGSDPGSGPGPVPADGALRPGQAADTVGNLHDLAYGNLIPEASEFRAQWQQIQFKFVDDPQASVGEAAHVVAQVTARLEAAIKERQRIIQERQQALRDRWSDGANADTETLRETLRMYRGFLDQLLGASR